MLFKGIIRYYKMLLKYPKQRWLKSFCCCLIHKIRYSRFLLFICRTYSLSPSNTRWFDLQNHENARQPFPYINWISRPFCPPSCLYFCYWYPYFILCVLWVWIEIDLNIGSIGIFISRSGKPFGYDTLLQFLYGLICSCSRENRPSGSRYGVFFKFITFLCTWNSDKIFPLLFITPSLLTDVG